MQFDESKSLGSGGSKVSLTREVNRSHRRRRASERFCRRGFAFRFDAFLFFLATIVSVLRTLHRMQVLMDSGS